MSLTQLFCDADDFCKVFIPEWEKTQIESSEKKRKEEGSAALVRAKLSLSLFIITNQGMVRSSGFTCAIYRGIYRVLSRRLQVTTVSLSYYPR